MGKIKSIPKTFINNHLPISKMKELTCKRCGHTWIPRIDNPIRCSKCKNKRWDEVVDDIKEEEEENDKEDEWLTQ